MGLDRLELSTPRLSSVCSNQLSYRPNIIYALQPLISFLLLLPNDFSASLASSYSFHQAISVGAYVVTFFNKHVIRIYHLCKEVIQPQVPLRLPCYDFTPVMNHTVVSEPLTVILPTSGTTHSHGVTGGVYKARERIHRDILIRDY